MIKTICKDCVEVMQQIPDNYFDLCLTDPPYNIGKDYGKGSDPEQMDYDAYLAWSKLWFKEARRVSKGIILFPGTKRLDMWLKDIEYPKWIVCWFKPNHPSRVRTKIGGYIHWEPILVYDDVKLRKDAFYIASGFRQRIFKNTQHPNPKSIPLLVEILKFMHVKPIKVLDPFMGVGSTLIACKKLGINCVGIEIEQKYVDEANKYLNKTYENKHISNYLEW